MMDAGTSLLRDEGLGIGATELTFKRAFERVAATTGVRLTNASVIRRVWENQAEYQDDVLTAVAMGGDSGVEAGATAASLLPLLDQIDRSTPDGRLRGLAEVCRVGGAASLQAIRDSPHWALWVGVWVLAVTGPDSPRSTRVRGALQDGYESTTDLWMGLHGAVVAALGLRMREPLTLRQFTVAVGALVEGCALREGAEPAAAEILRPTGPSGELQEWTLFGIGLEALAAQFLEVDPDWRPEEVPGAAVPTSQA